MNRKHQGNTMEKQLHITCQVIRVRNQTQSHLVIYVNNTLCPGKHRKNKLGTIVSHGTYLIV